MLQLLIEHALIESRNIHVCLKACQNCRGRRVRFTHHKQNFISFIFHQGYCARIIKWIMAKFWSTLYSTSLPYIQLIFTSDLKKQQQLFFDCMYMFSLVYNFTVMPVILLIRAVQQNAAVRVASWPIDGQIIPQNAALRRVEALLWTKCFAGWWANSTTECSFKSWSTTMTQTFTRPAFHQPILLRHRSIVIVLLIYTGCRQPRVHSEPCDGRSFIFWQ